MSNGEILKRAGTTTGVVVGLVIAGWMGLINLAVSGLVISNTVRGIEPVSLIFVASMFCVVAYAGVVVAGVRMVIGGRGVRMLPRWLASRLAIIGLMFIGIAVLAMAVP